MLERGRASREATRLRRNVRNQTRVQDAMREETVMYEVALQANIGLLETGLCWLYHDGTGTTLDESAFRWSVCAIIDITMTAARRHKSHEHSENLWLESPIFERIEMSQVLENAEGGPKDLAQTLQSRRDAFKYDRNPEQSLKQYECAYFESLKRVYYMVEYTLKYGNSMNRKNRLFLDWAKELLTYCRDQLNSKWERERH